MTDFTVTTDVVLNSQSVVDKVDALLDDPTLLKVQTAFAETIDPWTPFKSGALHSDITITPQGVRYNVPYSAEKYFGTVYTKTVHPLATSHWDVVALQTEQEALENKIKAILIARARELYG